MIACLVDLGYLQTLTNSPGQTHPQSYITPSLFRAPERSLQELLDGYPYSSSLETRARYIAQKLQLSEMVHASDEFFVGCIMNDSKKYWKLPEIVENLARCYCDTLAVEATHLPTQEQVEWIAQRMENRKTLSSSLKRHILQSLIDADQFERFLAQKFPATKR